MKPAACRPRGMDRASRQRFGGTGKETAPESDQTDEAHLEPAARAQNVALEKSPAPRGGRGGKDDPVRRALRPMRRTRTKAGIDGGAEQAVQENQGRGHRLTQLARAGALRENAPVDGPGGNQFVQVGQPDEAVAAQLIEHAGGGIAFRRSDGLVEVAVLV